MTGSSEAPGCSKETPTKRTSPQSPSAATDVASAPTANELTAQLVTLFTPVIGTALTKKAKILDYLPLAFLVADHEDTTALRSALDTQTLTNGTKQRVNCLLVSASPGFSQAPPQRDSTRLITDPRGRNQQNPP